MATLPAILLSALLFLSMLLLHLVPAGSVPIWGSPEKVDSESGQKSFLVKKYGEAHYDKTEEVH